MIPEKLPPAVARAMLRRIQQNGRKKENDHGEKEALLVFCSHWVPLGLSGTGSELSSALLLVPSLPEDPFPKPLLAYRDNEWEQEAKQMVTEPFLSSTHPWCYSVLGKKWKAESYLGGELDCFLLSYNSLNLKLLSNCVFFFQSFPLKSTLFLRKILM